MRNKLKIRKSLQKRLKILAQKEIGSEVQGRNFFGFRGKV